MIKFENVGLASPEQMEFIIQGMRNPMNSWEKSLPYSELITVKKKPFSVLSPMLEPEYTYAQNECINPDVDQISEYLKTLWLSDGNA